MQADITLSLPVSMPIEVSVLTTRLATPFYVVEGATDAQVKGQLQPHDDGQVADETLSTVAKAGVTIAV